MSDSQKAINSDVGGIKTKWIIVTICIIVLIVFGLYFVNFPHHLSYKNEVWGTFGDYVGGILNPVIAAFVFYFVVESYKLQKTELEATRKLLEVSTKAQKDQKKLAALTALLNANLTRISLLEQKKNFYKDVPASYIKYVIQKRNSGIEFDVFISQLTTQFTDIIGEIIGIGNEGTGVLHALQSKNKIQKILTQEIICYINGESNDSTDGSDIIDFLFRIFNKSSDDFKKDLKEVSNIIFEIDRLNDKNVYFSKYIEYFLTN